MKHKISIALFVCAMFIFCSSEASIWRVNNNANASNGSNFGGTAVFPVFQQILGTGSASLSNLVQSGDTVYLEGSTSEYNGGILKKKLIIIGQGYFLHENPGVSNNFFPCKIKDINFSSGSEGSQLIGVQHVGNATSGIEISTSDITIKRCLLGFDIQVHAGISAITIVQNFFSKVFAGSAIATTSDGFPVDFIFDNNIVLGTLVLPIGYTMTECRNNVFAGPAIVNSPSLRVSAIHFRNNILVNPAAIAEINGNSGSNVDMSVSYNTGASASQFGSSFNNLVVPDMTSLFVTSGTSDGKYQLKPGSAPGADGADRGAFGGAATSSRYTLSGLAPIPVIYQINTPGVAGAAGLPVTIQARTIK